MKRLFTLLLLAVLVLTGCTSKAAISNKSFSSAFKSADKVARRFTANDKGEVVGKNIVFDAEKIAKAENLDDAKKAEIDKFFDDFTTEITTVIDELDLTEAKTQDKAKVAMLYRIDVNIDKDAFIIYEDGSITVKSGKESINYEGNEMIAKTFEGLYNKMVKAVTGK